MVRVQPRRSTGCLFSRQPTTFLPSPLLTPPQRKDIWFRVQISVLVSVETLIIGMDALHLPCEVMLHRLRSRGRRTYKRQGLVQHPCSQAIAAVRSPVCSPV
ncbi:hypothetical protein AFLA_007063 [Aspergillus flavus NRRL3357]|nr:hypothetical protein AFLA_007063 [Aspergillus flavus NRRL3357]